MHARGEVVEWIPRPERRGDAPIPKHNDFIWLSRDGAEWELKSPKARYGTIKNAIASDAGAKHRFVIDLGGNRLTPKLRNQLARYNVRTQGPTIDELVVMSDDGLRLGDIPLK